MKKKMAVLLAALVVLSSVFAGCSKKPADPGKDNSVVENNDGSKGEGTKEQGKTEEVVTLKWVQLGSGMPTNYDAWLKVLNSYLEEKIGVNVDVEVISWGDWGNRRNVMINSGEYFDILFTDSGNFMSDINIGAYYNIKDILATASPELYEFIPADYWEAVTVNDGVYAVPTYKDSSLSNYIVWDKALAEKYAPDYKNLNTLMSLTDTLKAIKEGEGIVPFPIESNGLSMILSLYDGMGIDLPFLGVRYNDESRTVVNVLEQDDIMEQLKTIHSWYKDGIINADAPTVDQGPTYKAVAIAQGWPSAAITTWGPNMGVEAEAIQINETIVSNSTVRGSMNAIYAGSKYPEKSLQLLQLVNLDTKVRDMFYYGLEGENFDYVDGKINKLNSEWPMAGYTQGTFFTISPLADTEFNQWDEVKALNEVAKPSVLLGFSMEASNIQNELANCKEVYTKYQSELMTGSRNPEELIPVITAELKAAGLDKIMTEAQAQIDAYYK